MVPAEGDVEVEGGPIDPLRPPIAWGWLESPSLVRSYQVRPEELGSKPKEFTTYLIHQ